jgi:hypothetical protein
MRSIRAPGAELFHTKTGRSMTRRMNLENDLVGPFPIG